MLRRCTNENDLAYSRYGGKGIKCSWEDFEAFKLDMYNLYQAHIKRFGEKETTLERIDNNGHYCKENCRWATYLEQGNNKRNNIRIKIRDQEKTLSEWIRELNLKYTTIYMRIKRGWPPVKALTHDCVLVAQRIERGVSTA